MTSRVHDRLEESSTSPLRYPTETVQQYISDGERFYVARTGSLTTTQTLTQTPNTLMFDLEDDCIQVERVLWSNAGVYYPLHPTTPREMDDLPGHSIRWVNQTGTRSTQYFIFGMDKIALHPMITTGTETYIIHYQRDVPDSAITGATTPIEDHEFLVNYGVARCLLAEGKVKEGMAEYAEYKRGVISAARRMQNVDRLWAMSGSGLR